MSILKAAQHYGLARKQYKFEMKIHRLILPCCNTKLLARILWSRRKKHTDKYKTSWISGKEHFAMNQVISHRATIFLTSTTNEIQSKFTTITIEIIHHTNDTNMNRLKENKRKHLKYCSFKIDLCDYIDASAAKKVFNKHLKYKNHSATKQAEIIFSIHATEIHAIIKDERDSLFSEDTSNISITSGGKTCIESLRFNELRKKYVANQRHQLLDNIKETNIVNNNNNNNEEEEEESYVIPIIMRHNNNNNSVMAESVTTTTTNTMSTDRDREKERESPYDLYTKYVQKKHNEDDPPPFSIDLDEKKNKKSIAGSAISICSTSSDDDIHDDDIECKQNVNDMDLKQLQEEVMFYKKKRMNFERLRVKLRSNEEKMEKLKQNIKHLQRNNARLHQKVASLQTVIEHKNNEIFNSFSVFKYLAVSEALELRIRDYIDHRDESGHFLLAKILDLKHKKHKHLIFIHYEGWDTKWDIWINVNKECTLNRIAPARSISRKTNTRFIDLQISDNIDLNPTQRNEHKGWKCAIIKKLDKYSGQVQCQYIYKKEKLLYWAHLNDQSEIAPAMTKSCDMHH